MEAACAAVTIYHRRCSMVPSRNRAVSFFSAVPVFILVLIAIVFAETLFRTLLHPELHSPDSNHLLIRSITALVAPLLIITFFLRTRHLATEIKKMELLRAKEDWEKTFNTMTDFVSVHDQDFTVIKANHALCEFLNKRPEEIVGKPCFQVFHNLDRPYENCPHRKTSATAHPVSEIINDPHLGVPIQITCSPFFDQEGSFHGSLHIARVTEEITPRKNIAGKFFPICAACKHIRDSDNTWLPIEDYFFKKHEFRFTHTFCNDCRDKLYPEYGKLQAPR